MRNARIRRIRLVTEPREDGGLRIHSPDVLGLHLSGAEPFNTWKLVEPGIVRLLDANEGVEVLSVDLPLRPVIGDTIEIDIFVASD